MVSNFWNTLIRFIGAFPARSVFFLFIVNLLILYKSEIFEINRLLFVSTGDTFNGYFTWLNLIKSGEIVFENGNIKTYWINYPVGEFLLNKFDIFYLIPKVFGVIISALLNPIWAVNLWILTGFFLTFLCTFCLIYNISAKPLLSLILSQSFTFMPYFIYKSEIHPNYIHFWWIPLSIWIALRSNSLEKAIVITFMSLLLDPYNLLFIPITVFILVNLVYKKNCKIKLKMLLLPLSTIALVAIAWFTYFSALESDETFRTKNDIYGFSLKFNDFLTSHFVNRIVQRSSYFPENALYPRNDESGLFPNSVIIFITITVFIAIFIRIFKRVKLQREIIILVFAAIFTVFLMVPFDLKIFDMKIVSPSIWLLEVFPFARAYLRLYSILVFILILIFAYLYRSQINFSRYLGVILSALIFFDYFLIYFYPPSLLDSRNNSFTLLSSLTKKSDVIYFIDPRMSNEYFGWQYVFGRKISNGRDGLINSKSVGPLDPNASCLYDASKINVVALPKNLLTEINDLNQITEQKFDILNNFSDDTDYLYIRQNSNCSSSLTSDFTSGFWPTDINLRTGAWTNDYFAEINFRWVGKSLPIEQKIVKFMMYSLIQQEVQITSSAFKMSYTVDKNGVLIELPLVELSPIFIESNEMYIISDKIGDSTDKRRVSLFLTRPFTS